MSARPATSARPARLANARRAWVPGLGVLLLLLAVYLPTARPETAITDVVSAELGAWSVATTGQPWLDGVASDVIPGREPVELFVYPGAGGHLVAYRSPGVVMAGVPAYWLRGGGHDASDFSGWPGSFTGAVLTALGVSLLLAALRRVTATGVAVAAALVVGLGTPLWTTAADGLWTHSVTVVGLAGMAAFAVRERWWLAGAFGGLALCGRLHLAVVVAVLGLGLAITRRRPGIAVRMGLASGLGLVVSSVWSHWVYGTWLPVGGYADHVGQLTHSAQGWESQLGLWLSPQRGLLPWSPLLVLLLPALVRAWRRGLLPDWSRWLLVGGLVYTLVQGRLNGFTGGDGFWGYRLMIEPMVCAVPALVAALPAAGAVARRAVVPLAALQVTMMLPASLSGRYLLRQGHEWIHHDLVVAVVSSPSLGGLLAVVWVSLSVIGWHLTRGWWGRVLDVRPGSAGSDSASSGVSGSGRSGSGPSGPGTPVPAVGGA